ncbi:MAG: glycosyltransferase, partial [Bacteroidales bacterium]|nr:glycosyltransferase [Bacteroidales bacterium]
MEEINKIFLLQEEYLGKQKPINKLNPIVSIRVNTYQHVNFIKECLNSILMQQTNFEYEIVLGEDESTDGTREICIEYAKKHPDKIRLFLRDRKLTALYDEQGKFRKSLNSTFTFKSCRGKYLAACEGDDYWTDPYKLQKQVDFLEANPEYAGCFHETQQILEDGSNGKIYGKDAKPIMTTEDTFSTLSPFHTSSFVFRNLIKELPDWFYKVVSGDMALFSIISSFGPLGKISEIMSVYRKHEGGFTNRAEIVNTFHQKRIELIDYLNEFHNYKYDLKAKKVKEIHKRRMMEEKLVSNTIQTKNGNYNKQKVQSKGILHPISNNHSEFLNPQLTIENMDKYYIRKSILNAIKEHLPGFHGTLLDVGCGEMPYKQFILSNSKVEKYVGLDIENPLYQQTVKPDMFWDGKKIPLQDNFVDTVIATEVFEHVPVLEVVLKEINRVLKPGGILFFTVPYLWPLHDAPHDEYRYTPYSLRRHLTNSGFRNIDIKPMGNWNSSLAQILGLWLRRAPMNESARGKLSEQFFPFYTKLVEADNTNSDFSSTTMFIGMYGLVKKDETTINPQNCKSDKQNRMNIKGDNRVVAKGSSQPVLAIICPQIGAASETFIKKHIDFISPDKTVVLTGNIFNNSWFNGPVKIIPIQIGDYAFDKNLEKEVLQFFKENSVTHILCEFGCIGGAVLKLNQHTLKLPAYVHFHGQDSSEFLRKPEVVKYYQWMADVVDGVIVVSKPMRERLINIGIPKGKIRVIHSGVDVSKEILSHPEDEPCRLISVSRLVPKKGIFYVLKAFELAAKTVSNISLDIIGDGPLKAEIEKYIREHNLAGFVKLHGQQPHQYVLDIMDNSSIFVQHSITDPETGNREGLPITILEAHAHGLPVISTFHEGIPEAVEHNITGLLVNEGDWELMAEYIIKLAQDGDLRKQMGLAGREKILSDGFTVEAMLEKLRNFMNINLNQIYQPTNQIISVKHSILKRVLFVNHNLYPYEKSGTPISTLNHALGMQEKGVDVAILIPSPGVREGFEKQVDEKFILYKLPRLDKYSVFFGEIENSILNNYFESVEKIIDDFMPDLVQINDYVYMPEEIIPLFHKKGISVVRNVCNLEEICHMDSPVVSSGLQGKLCSGPESSTKCAICFFNNKLGKPNEEIDSNKLKEISAKIQKRFDSIQSIYTNNVDGVIFTTNHFKEYFTKFINIPEDRITIIPRGFKFNFNRVTEPKKITSKKICFAFIGHLMFSKGIDVALNAFEEIAATENFHLDIYGTVVDQEYSNWINKIEKRFPKKFKYQGSFKKENIKQIADRIDVAIVPSYFDTYNRIVRELLYFGVPLIVTDFFGSYVIENKLNGLKINVGDSKALSRAMQQIIKNPKILGKLSQGVVKTLIPSLENEIENMDDF